MRGDTFQGHNPCPGQLRLNYLSTPCPALEMSTTDLRSVFGNHDHDTKTPNRHEMFIPLGYLSMLPKECRDIPDKTPLWVFYCSATITMTGTGSSSRNAFLHEKKREDCPLQTLMKIGGERSPLFLEGLQMCQKQTNCVKVAAATGGENVMSVAGFVSHKVDGISGGDATESGIRERS